MGPRKKPRNRPKGEDAALATRRIRALDLRRDGASYRVIATALGISVKTAYEDVQHELGALDVVSKEKAERLRDLEACRLDGLQLALTNGVRSGNPGAVLAVVRIMERRARLFGLDAPTKIAGPEGDAVPIRIVHREVRA